jgi:acetyl-CoA carboxylase carboxyl transferase subunit alpha
MKTALTAWDKVQISRNVQRPRTLDYVRILCDNFFEFHGDRRYADDAAIVAGVGRIMGRSVMIIGHQKGRDTRENMKRNFGMPKPDGYRKALRLFHHAEKFALPVICLIDTPGADPSMESESRGQGNAIAENILIMAQLRTPLVSFVIGEGGSGGALAIGVTDRIFMLEHSIYSVAAPEASAAILWRDSSKAADAAKTMRITAQDLHGLSSLALTEVAQKLLLQIAVLAQQITTQAQAIKFRDIKLERITFELARLKAWRFGAKTERMDAEQRQFHEQYRPDGPIRPRNRLNNEGELLAGQIWAEIEITAPATTAPNAINATAGVIAKITRNPAKGIQSKDDSTSGRAGRSFMAVSPPIKKPIPKPEMTAAHELAPFNFSSEIAGPIA